MFFVATADSDSESALPRSCEPEMPLDLPTECPVHLAHARPSVIPPDGGPSTREPLEGGSHARDAWQPAAAGRRA